MTNIMGVKFFPFCGSMIMNMTVCCSLPACLIYLLVFTHYFIASTDCIDDHAVYTIKGDVSINCGSNGLSAACNGRKWVGDKHPKLRSSLQLNGTSTTSSVSISDDGQIPYKTARISRSAFSYTFLLNPGQKFIRLHFNPTVYKGFETRTDLFDVVAGPFVLLGNFSASLMSDALGLSYFTKEYCLNLEENQLLNISFSPATSRLRDAYAFINGIEIIPVTPEHSYFHGEDIGARVIGYESQLFYVDNGTALEMVHREKVSWDSASPDDDFSDIFGTVPKEKARVLNWKIPVDVGFRYLVRLQFSNPGLKMIEKGKLIFKVLINEIVACTNIDIFQVTDSILLLKHNHRDFIVITRGRKEDGRRDISLQSYYELIDGNGPFTGFEIFKLSNLDNSFGFPNSLPSKGDSPSWTFQSLLSIVVNRNVIQTVVIVLSFLANVNLPELRRILESEFLAEVETLSELRHVNLVSLIGYWKQRLDICIGAGRGLDYLHTGHAVIHRDVKVSNILLADSLKTFVQVVERCLDDEPTKRPTIAQVVVQLELALEQQENPRSLTSNERTSVAPHHDEANILVSGQRTSSSSNGQAITSQQSRNNDGANVLVNGSLTLTYPSDQTISPHSRKQTSRNSKAIVPSSRQLASSSTGERTMTSHGRVRTGHNDEANVFRSWQLTLSSPGTVSSPPPRARSIRNMDNNYPSSEGNQRNTQAYRPSFRRSWKAFVNRFKSPKKKKLPIPGIL